MNGLIEARKDNRVTLAVFGHDGELYHASIAAKAYDAKPQERCYMLGWLLEHAFPRLSDSIESVQI